MPIKPRNTDNVRSVELGAAATDHDHVEADITDLDHTDASAIHDDVSAEISAITAKATPTTSDLLLIEDAAASNAKKKITIGDLPAAAPASHTHVEADVTDLAHLTQEQVEDFVGAMLTGNTETLITVTYQDADGTIDFVVDADLANYTNTPGWIADITGSPLSELQDVTITSIASGEVIQWNGSAWINRTLAEAGISATGHTHVEANITDLDHNDTDAIHDNVSAEISVLSQKTTLVVGDHFLIEDSAASNAKKRTAFGNINGSLDHGTIAGLSDDDHTQYFNATRHKNDHASGVWRRATSNQTIANNTETTIVQNSNVHEDDADGDISFNTSTGTMTLNTAGVYILAAGIDWGSSATGYRQINIQHVGTGVRIVRGTQDASSVGETYQSVFAIYQASASDQFVVNGVQTSGGNLAATNNPATFFSVVKIY